MQGANRQKNAPGLRIGAGERVVDGLGGHAGRAGAGHGLEVRLLLLGAEEMAIGAHDHRGRLHLLYTVVCGMIAARSVLNRELVGLAGVWIIIKPRNAVRLPNSTHRLDRLDDLIEDGGVDVGGLHKRHRDAEALQLPTETS